MEKNERREGGTATARSISLIDLVFSWSIEDVINKDLLRGQVKKIPKTFNSMAEYFNSFIAPLIEETHSELFSSMTRLSQAPSREVNSVERDRIYIAPGDLFYNIFLRVRNTKSKQSDSAIYQPQIGDLLALTDVKPTCISDLNRPKMSYVLTYVQAVDENNPNKLSVLSSKPIVIEQEMQREEKLLGQSSENISQQKHTVFCVFLINMITNIRIWKALNPDPMIVNLSMINKVIQLNGADEEDCAMCLFEENSGSSINVPSFESYRLNDSQEAAILSCINTLGCRHQNTVKLIWGPPGTGKTRTVCSLLHALLGMKCRTVTCAPTNIAVVALASRFMGMVIETLEYDTYGFGDIVLFGNRVRMRIDDYEDLLDVFLDYRVEILKKCFSPHSGWKTSLESMIDLLEDPEGQYSRYLANRKQENSDEKHKMEADENSDENRKDRKSRNAWKNVINETLKQEETKKEHVTYGKENHSEPITLEEFVKKRYYFFNERLNFCVVNLYTHLPTSLLSLELVKIMRIALDLLRSLETLLSCFDFGDEGLKKAFNYIEEGSESGDLAKLRVARKNCLEILKLLHRSFEFPVFVERFMITNFCLNNACLLFCTASSTSRLNNTGTPPLELLVIDEAAQLKESESVIPLQLPGLHHAILVGDEHQLPAMIQSKVLDSILFALDFNLLRFNLSDSDIFNLHFRQISSEAEFGRSLFERLVLLGQKKHLLNVQYRMHPAISLFPNNEFYEGKISDAEIVKKTSHEKRFLHGSMYGAYSFINVACGKEQFDRLHSLKNMVEVALVCQIVAGLFKEFTVTKQNVRVGVISPYSAQVRVIQEKLEKKYAEYADSGFVISIRSVDGFQGAEEDVTIVSTVRCNINGFIGFLSNQKRTNVALTRARHCLWILGNEATFLKSDSVWKRLVIDAKRRGCFFNADEDKNLAQAIITALIELEQFQTLLSMDSPLFKEARWRVCFSNEFWKSLATIKNTESHKQMVNLLEKLSSGWRQTPKRNDQSVVGASLGLLEVYPVDEFLNLLWSVDIIKEASHFIQVLKVWDIIPLSDTPKIVQNLETLFGQYTASKMSRCKTQCLEGNVVVPMSWPMEGSHVRIIRHDDDNMQGLSRPFASLSVVDESSSSNADFK